MRLLVQLLTWFERWRCVQWHQAYHQAYAYQREPEPGFVPEQVSGEYCGKCQRIWNEWDDAWSKRKTAEGIRRAVERTGK